jgi:hypothetical protein
MNLVEPARLLVDLANRCFTPDHPDAQEAMADGVIPLHCLTLHINVTSVRIFKVSQEVSKRSATTS